jgi:hypothetical protein
MFEKESCKSVEKLFVDIFIKNFEENNPYLEQI